MIKIDELFSTPAHRRHEVIRLRSAGEGLEHAVAFARAGEAVLLITDAAPHELISPYRERTREAGLGVYVADMLSLPLAGAAEHGDAPKALIVDPITALAVDVGILERGLRRLSVDHDIAIVLAGMPRR